MMHFFEKLPVSMRFSNCKILKDFYSESHRIQLLEHSQLGKILIIDDEVQHVEKWSPLYHEPLVHLAFAVVEVPKNILILGGGSLYAAVEVLKYNSIEKLILVDHDLKIIELMLEFYSHSKLVLNDSRFELVNLDINEYLDKSDCKFDIILNDCSESYDESLKLKDNLAEKIFNRLSPEGICSDMIYRNIYYEEALIKTSDFLQKKYNVFFSLLFIPEYPGILHLLSIWGQSENIKQDLIVINKEQKKWIKESNPCIYYNPSFMNYYSYLPKYLKDVIFSKA